ncbi:hypothetical protein H0H93_000009 [Arthromyces matolae]|nr:hypothetical protein H0H93_000009 [Arthromyces matolae]
MDAQGDSPVFDSLDVDIFIKVLAHTLFGFIKWCSRLYRNQRGLFFGPAKFDWGSQIVVITGGSSGVGELLANTLAVRNVTVVVLDIKPIVTENYNISYYKCDVSRWEEVDAVSRRIIEEVGESILFSLRERFDGFDQIGEPTVLVNNAGVVQGKLILDLTPADIQKCPQIRTTLVTPGHILTPMFQTFSMPETAFHKFLFPSVQPVAVVKKVIAALDEQDSQDITLPFYTHAAPYLRLFPSFARDFFQWRNGHALYERGNGGNKDQIMAIWYLIYKGLASKALQQLIPPHTSNLVTQAV